MKQIVELLREKSQLQYHINAIKEYIDDKNYDMRLKEVWDSYNIELKAVDEKINSLSMPAIEEFEKEKLRLLAEIRVHEEALENCRSQIKELQRLTKLINLS